MRWAIVSFFILAIVTCGWLYYATPPSGQPVDERIFYAVGIYVFAAAAIISVFVSRGR